MPDEAIGFPAGFIRAGVPGILSTLWPVNDISTALLLVKFYERHLKDDLEPAAALREAQLWLKASSAKDLQLAECYERVYLASGNRDVNAYKAMRHYRANPEAKLPFEHPYFWAAFTFTGV